MKRKGKFRILNFSWVEPLITALTLKKYSTTSIKKFFLIKWLILNIKQVDFHEQKKSTLIRHQHKPKIALEGREEDSTTDEDNVSKKNAVKLYASYFIVRDKVCLFTMTKRYFFYNQTSKIVVLQIYMF